MTEADRKRANGDWLHIRGDRNEEVRLGPEGLRVRDGKSRVHIGPGGIHVRDGDDEIRIGRKGDGMHTDRQNRRLGGPYRSRRGILLGVCRGLADYFEMSVFWMRVLWFLAFLFSGFWPIVFVYFVLALLIKPEPAVPFASESDAEFYHSAAHNRRMAAHRLRRLYESLERRIQRMESVVTSKEFDWQRRMNEGR